MYHSSRPSAKAARIESASGGDEGQVDYIDRLPDELLCYIFGFLPEVEDRCRCAAVSRKWLLTQVLMQKSDFRSDATQRPPERKVTRIIRGGEANDVRLSFMSLAAGAWGTLTNLSIAAQLPPLVPCAKYRTVSDFGLLQVAKAGGGLRYLHLANFAGITASGIASVADGCPLLQELALVRVVSLIDDGLVYLAKRCQHLASLSLVQCPGISDMSLYAFGTHSSRLKSFHLVSCPLVTDHGAVSIVAGRPDLETLKITSSGLSVFFLQAIAYYGKRVRVLELDSIWGLSVEDYIWIGAARGLQSLKLTSCTNLADQSYLGGMVNSFVLLKQLAIENSPALTDEGLARITKAAKKLEFLSLENCHGFTCAGLLLSLSNCTRKLRELRIAKCSFLGGGETQDIIQVPDQSLTQFSRLVVVELDQCQGLGDEFILWLGQSCKGIEDVGFIGMEAITDRGIEQWLKQLKGSNKIIRMNLTGCTGIGDRSVWAITRECKKNLRSLVLKGCGRVSDRGVAVISKRCTELEELDVGGCDITDEGVRKLVVDMPIDLEAISFEGCCKITDESLYELEDYCGLSLDRVNVAQCKGVSMKMVHWLQQFFGTVVR